MKTTTKILLTITIILGALITAAALTIDSIDTTETGIMVNFKDGTGYYIEKANKEAEPFGVTNVLYESSEDFYLEPNEIGIEFSDGISWAIANMEANKYVFQAIELGDWDYNEFDSLEDFENCIKTYISIKNTGSY